MSRAFTPRCRFVAGFLVLLFALVLPAASVLAQTSEIDRAISSKPLAVLPMTFPGPFGGYMFVHIPVEQIGEAGDTSVKTKAFLVDMNISHEGIFLSPDTLQSTRDAIPFVFPVAKNRAIHAKLAPSHMHEEYRGLDSSYAGSIGYGLLQKYTTVFDFKSNEIRFYPLLTDISFASDNPRVLKLPVLDDAYLTYCHCPYSTIWLDVTAPPLSPGRVQLAPQEAISQIFEDAIDAKTKALLGQESRPEQPNGAPPKVGLNVGTFKIGGKNIAGLSPHRAVDPLPPAFHDLSVNIIGTLGNDVLRKFSALIIDPSRQSLYFIR